MFYYNVIYGSKTGFPLESIAGNDIDEMWLLHSMEYYAELEATIRLVQK